MLKKLMAVLALLVLVAVGCGGDDSSGGDDEAEDRSDEPADEEEEGPTEDGYAEEVSDLCSDWFSGALETDGTIREILEEVQGSAEDLSADIEDVEAPEELEEDADALVDTLGSYTEFLGALAAQVAETEASYGDSAVISGLAPQDQEQVLVAREDLVGAFDEVDADCGFDEAESELAPFEDQSGEDEPEEEDDPLSTVPVGEAQAPEDFIIEYGTEPEFDALASDCYLGDYAACDELFLATPVSESLNSYEGYGASCGGRRTEEGAGTCASTL